jgi:predicted nucleic acid-binding protein
LRRVLFDLNVILDFVLDRSPHAAPAALLWAAAERNQIDAFLPAHGITTVFYIVARHHDQRFARRVMDDLLLVPKIAPVDGPVLRRALALGWPDFEDAVCAAAAESVGCDAIISRDVRGFPKSPVRVLEPRAALALLNEGPDHASEPLASVPRSSRAGGSVNSAKARRRRG